MLFVWMEMMGGWGGRSGGNLEGKAEGVSLRVGRSERRKGFEKFK